MTEPIRTSTDTEKVAALLMGRRETNTTPQTTFNRITISNIGRDAAQTNGSPVTGISPCSAGSRQPADASFRYKVEPPMLSVKMSARMYLIVWGLKMPERS